VAGLKAPTGVTADLLHKPSGSLPLLSVTFTYNHVQGILFYCHIEYIVGGGILSIIYSYKLVNLILLFFIVTLPDVFCLMIKDFKLY